MVGVRHETRKLEADDFYQCIYCGRFMRDRKATRRVEEDGWVVYACVACDAVMPLYRGKKLSSKQRHAINMFKVKKNPKPGYVYYVSRDGAEFEDADPEIISESRRRWKESSR